MLRQRKLRDRLVAMAAPPVLVAVAAAIGALVLADGQNGTRIGLIAVAAAIVVGAWSFLVGWTLIRSVNSLAIAADGLAEAQLRIANGELEASELPGIDHGGPADEIGRVAEAVDAISRSAVDMAESQRESIRKGLATIVINLARRNQSLLDRQVEYLDTLEQTEEDPDRLGELFRVDHLATRMRRNAESLLVLAGADTVKRKGAPVAMSDVLRVAIGEVENYQHIELGIIEDGEVPAGVAVDLAHLSAELMENATQFSPPSTAVEVSAVIDRPTQSFRISIADRGMGLGDRLELANETLANPPELGLGMGRSLGFMVIGRLARRLGATVQLRLNDGGGTIADVDVPLALFQLDEPDQPEPVQEPATVQAPPPAAVASPAPAPAEAPAPWPTSDRQGAASTALDKLLGIAPKISAPAPTETPAVAPVPAPAAEAAPMVDAAQGESAWQQSSPFGDADLVADSDSLPPPADDPTWSSMTVESGPTAEVSWSPEAAPAPAPAPADTQADEPSWTPPPMPPASEKRDDATSSWTPPPMPAPNPVDESWAPPTAAPPSRLEEAVPSGDAFESGVASLLNGPESARTGESDTGWPDTSPGVPAPPSGLQRRERGASNVPIGQGRPVAAPSRSPEEVRSMLSRYRDGLKDGKQGSGPGSPDAHDDKDGER